MSELRMAGSESLLPLLMAASGDVPGLSIEQQIAAQRRLEELDPELLAASQGWTQEAAKPGNTWILPNQGTEHEKSADGFPRWQYPFFRSALVEAGLLPRDAPAGNPKELRVPPGMSVLEAIRAGVIR